MNLLYDLLLHRREWTEEQKQQLIQLQKEICTKWTDITGNAATPKVHMLHHAIEFVLKHHHMHLGLYAESQIESCHAQFNRQFNDINNNLGDRNIMIAERLRRSLANIILKLAH